MSQHSLWEELKRRNVLRAAAFYAGAAWLVVQVATQVFPFFDVPNRTVRWVVLAAVLGLPFALGFSWFYELTPQGLMRESALSADASIPRGSARRFDRWIVGVLALAVVVLLAGLFVARKPAAGPAATDRSVAVLPFENLSDDKSNAYFAQGIQDEILTRLSKVGALRVISRTSTERYASQPDDLSEIAQRLGVANVLEGSVQKAGNAVHINVQLIRAADDQHIWAETYDRKLDDVFGVEGEVAQAIADALNARLTGAEHQAMRQVPTRDPKAYDDYLRGLAYESRFDSDQSVQESVRHFRAAVDQAPDFALAWAHLSIQVSYLYLNGIDRTPQALEQMRQAAEKALALQPELGEAWLARGYYDYRGLSDYDAALQAFEQASRRMPGSAEASAASAYVLRRQGEPDQALARLQSAIQIDPQNLSYWNETIDTLSALRRYDQAQATIEHALQANPGNLSLETGRAVLYATQGDLDTALKLLASLPRQRGLASVGTDAMLLLLQRRYAESADAVDKLLAQGTDRFGDQAVGLYALLGYARSLAGDAGAAQAAFAKARALAASQQDGGRDSYSTVASLGMIDAFTGHRERALEEGRRAVELTGSDHWIKGTIISDLAQIQAMVGDRDDALATLRQLLSVPQGISPGELRYHPVWDGLRRDPRFAAILAAAAKPIPPP